MDEGTKTWQNRIAEGRPHHGLGPSTYLPGNVSHLVSPVVGRLRLRAGLDEPLSDSDMLYIIDRLSMVLELAREQAEQDDLTPPRR